MPNHITNRLTFSGEERHIETIREVYTTKAENGVSQFPDFEKVISTSEEAKASYGTPGLNPRWYVEQCALWGTKWNSYSCEAKSAEIYEFETAWSAPHPVIATIARNHPDVKIVHEYADEDTGYNCGVLVYEGGECVSELRPPGGSKAAYELAFRLCPEKAECYVLVDGNYEPIED